MPLKTRWSGSQAPARSVAASLPAYRPVRASGLCARRQAFCFHCSRDGTKPHDYKMGRQSGEVAHGGSIVACMMQGLGEELALCFASHGAKLILSARNKERLEVHFLSMCYCLSQNVIASSIDLIPHHGKRHTGSMKEYRLPSTVCILRGCPHACRGCRRHAWSSRAAPE
jgi:hypothetical protein